MQWGPRGRRGRCPRTGPGAKGCHDVKFHAYVMAADPAWVEDSVLSYYDVVDRIVVSFDRHDEGWTGEPIRAAETVARLRAIDREGKCVFAPGSFATPGLDPLEADTRQRQSALDLASEGADWVLQIDTDEILPAPGYLLDAVRAADRRDFEAVDFPSRRIVQHVRGDEFLEECRTWWRVATSYPGPLAVRAGVTLTLARRASSHQYRVDVRPKNCDPHRSRFTPVHAVVPSDAAVLHMTWVRSTADMHAKVGAWGHAHDRDWGPVIAQWELAQRHPWRAALARPGVLPRLRRTHLANGPDAESRLLNGLRS